MSVKEVKNVNAVTWEDAEVTILTKRSLASIKGLKHYHERTQISHASMNIALIRRNQIR
jgi:predicted transport protein